MSASALKSLSFTTMPAVGANPVVDRRHRVIAKLEEQKSLAKDANFKRSVRRRVEEGGQKKLVEKAMKVQPWWRPMPDGSLAFAIRMGKPVEFVKDQTAVAVKSLDELPSVIDALIAATRAGELDNQLAAASTKPQAKKVKK